MANDHTIKTFTAIDIEKYHKGELSAREMHAMEKAALDDPFLADALEGYAVPGVNAAADMAELKKRLDEKTSRQTKVIPIAPAGKSSFPWLRAAAMVVLIAGSGFLIYKLAFSDAKQDNYAQAPLPEKKTTDSVTANAGQAMNGESDDRLADTIQSSKAVNSESDTEIEIGLAGSTGKSDYSTSYNAETNNTHYFTPSPNSVQPVAPKLDSIFPQQKEMQRDLLADKKISPADDKQTRNTLKGKTDTASVYGMTEQAYDYRSDNYKDIASARRKPSASQGYLKAESNHVRHNIFRGRVMDANNNPLPFANITNTADNVGTYSDVKGNFTLISPDSVLNVQVRSVGFENSNLQLQANVRDNQVIMQEDNGTLNEIVVSNRAMNTNRARNNTLVHEEPEPVDGWSNYDIYVANNLNIPDTLKKQPSFNRGEVELSFDVNKNGEPVNITVDKSLCESCDKEAIRLLKQGPKWKNKSRKKKRTSVTISF